MSKGGFKEVRGPFRDPRSDDTGAPVASSVRKPLSSSPGRPSLADVMRELSLDIPPPPPQASDGPAYAGAAASSGAAAAPAPPSSVRDPFGIVGTVQAETFEVHSVVAHGGFGVIYKARHSRFNAPVALKCLKIPTNLSPEQRDQFFERFRAEGEVMFRLSGSIPEVVRPIHVDALRLRDGRFVPFIALEWLEGETLKDVIVRRLSNDLRPLSLPRIVSVLTPVARARARAHHFPGPEGPLAILHCDIKPDNLFLSKSDAGECFKIFDFGIAKVRSAATRVAGGATTADASSSMFTPAYAAPEQWAPDKFGQTGPWTDVFALALTVTELVTQKPAIDGPPAAMLAQCMDASKRPTPRRLGLDIPPAVEAIFTRALAVDPKQRTQSVEQLWGDLERALGLPLILGASGRASVPAISPVLPPGWSHGEDDGTIGGLGAAEAPGAGALATAGPSQDLPSLDLDLPRSAPLAAPPAPPPPAVAQPAAGGFPGLELGDLAPPRPPASPYFAPPPASAPSPMVAPDRGALDFEDAAGDMSGSFDLAAEPARPAGPPQATMAASAYLSPPGYGPQEVPSAPASSQTRDRLQQAAARAGAVASKAGAVAGKAAVIAAGAAASSAKSLAIKAVTVERVEVRLDQPSTWVKPMRGPLVAMLLSFLIAVVAVIASKATGSTYKVGYVTMPLLFGSIGFAVYRFLKLQQGGPP